MACYNVVHVVILTQVELQQIDFHFTVLNKHAMLNHLGKKKETFGRAVNTFSIIIQPHFYGITFLTMGLWPSRQPYQLTSLFHASVGTKT